MGKARFLRLRSELYQLLVSTPDCKAKERVPGLDMTWEQLAVRFATYSKKKKRREMRELVEAAERAGIIGKRQKEVVEWMKKS